MRIKASKPFTGSVQSLPKLYERERFQKEKIPQAL